MKFRFSWIAGLALGLVAFMASAEDFPPISEAERALDEIPGQPGTPAVVLYEKGELKMMDYGREASSYLRVNVRTKILTEEGKTFGEVEIPHSGFYRLKDVEGRTVLPDGRVVPLPEDAIFEERRSRSLKRFTTKLAFPAVEVGAILDYRYLVRWNDLFFLEPWYFNHRVPTLLSEIVYIKPNNLGLVPWAIQSQKHPIQTEVTKTPKGAQIRAWSENLPAIPEEPYDFPFADLANRFMLIPKEIQLSGSSLPLMDSWRSTCAFYADDYKNAQRSDRKASRHAQGLAAGGSLVEKVAAIHAFVRDEIATLLVAGVGLMEDEKVDSVFESRRGSPAGQALLLQSMLAAIKVDSDLVWVAERTNGRIDLEVANPWWFDAVIVRTEIDGKPVYLDPLDPSVGMGHLSPYYDGMPAVVFDRKKPETIELPAPPHEKNLRRARVDLEIDGDGRVIGGGTLEVAGHQAWFFLRWKDDPEATTEAWKEYLEEKYPGYEVSEVEVDEDLGQQRIEVRWSLAQREEEVLGDEVTLVPSRPLGPKGQPFTLPPENRKTPVQMHYGVRDESIWTLSYPPGWEIEALPSAETFGGAVGTIELRVETDEAENRITVHRRFERPGREYVGLDKYRLLRDFYTQAAKQDAQSVVLINQ